MESTKLLHTEILTTLESIERVNDSIARHKNAAEPDQFAISQWQEMKDSLLKQLHALLAKLDALPAAVAA